MQTVNACSETKLWRIILVNNLCVCGLLLLLKKQPLKQHLLCIKLALIKSYHLPMSIRILLLLESCSSEIAKQSLTGV